MKKRKKRKLFTSILCAAGLLFLPNFNCQAAIQTNTLTVYYEEEDEDCVCSDPCEGPWDETCTGNGSYTSYPETLTYTIEEPDSLNPGDTYSVKVRATFSKSSRYNISIYVDGVEVASEKRISKGSSKTLTYTVPASSSNFYPTIVLYSVNGSEYAVTGTEYQFAKTITFQGNGGTGNMSNQTIAATGGYLANNGFSRSGYTFAGWSTSSNGTVQYTNGAMIYPTSDMTLYAIWSPINYNFDVNGGTGSVGTVIGTGSTKVPSYNGSKTGYTFQGWSTNSTATTATYTTGNTLPTITSGTTLYAVWSPINYSFNVNGGTGSVEAVIGTGSTKVPSYNGSKVGYTFKGWSTSSTATTATYTTGSTLPAITSAITLYAVWEVNSYTTSITNGGTGASGAGTHNYGSTVTIKAGTKTGYTFAGWTVNSGEVNLADASSSNTTFVQPAGNVSLTANWTVNHYTVTYHANGGSGSMDSSSIAYTGGNLKANAFTRTGYTFKGWATSASGSKVYENGANITNLTSDVTLYAVWEVNEYTTSITNGGTGASGAGTHNYGSTVTIKAGTKTGYTFTGWTINSGEVSLANASSSNTTFVQPAGNVSLTANWTINHYTVTYNANGGNGAMDSSSIAYTGGNLKANAFTRTGYTFKGWATSASGSKVYEDGAAITNLTSNITLYAIWEVNYYTVTYHANGGNGTMDVSSIAYTGGELKSNVFTKYGHTFKGWSTSASGGVQYSNNATITGITSNTTLYAVWEANKHNVAVNNGAAGSTGDMSHIAYGSTVTIDAGTKTGYTFAGWTVNRGNVILKDASSSKTTFTMEDYDVTVTASWKINQYQVTVDGNGGDGATGGGTYDYNSTIVIRAGSRVGYTFKEWEVTSGDITILDPTSPVTTFTLGAANVTIKAIWEVNYYNVTTANGGDDSTSLQRVPYQSTATIHAGSRYKYYFCGWVLVSGGVTLADETSPETTFIQPANDVVLTATWKNITGVSAVLNDNFDKQYTNDSYCSNGEYDITKGIDVTKDMITVNITFSDGSTMTAKNRDFELGNTKVKYVGTNNIEITLTAGSSGLEYVIPITGYSPDLAKLMAHLGLKRDDYIGLVRIVNEMEHKIQEDLAGYEALAERLQSILAEADIVVDLTGNTASDIHNLESGVREAVDRLLKDEKELTELKTIIDKILMMFEEDPDSDISKLPEILEKLKVEIEIVKSNEEVLLKEIVYIKEKLGITDTILNPDGTVNTEVLNQIKEKVDELTKDLDLYTKNLEELKELMGVENSGSLESQLEETTIKIIQTVEVLKSLENQLDEILKSLDNLGVDTEGKTLVEAITAQIKALRDYADSLRIYIDSLKGLLGLDPNTTNEELYQYISKMKENLGIYRQFLKEVQTVIQLGSQGGTVSEETNVVYVKIQDMYKQLQLYKELLKTLLGDAASNPDNAEELEELLKEVLQQQQETFDFMATLKQLVGLNGDATNKELYQKILNWKEILNEYGSLLDYTEELLKTEGTNGSHSLTTGAEAKEELNNVQTKITELYKQMELMKQAIKDLLNDSTADFSTIEELKELLEEIEKQQKKANRFIESLKLLVELSVYDTDEELYQKISAMKDTMQEYWQYLGKVEKLIEMPDGSDVASGSAIVTGPAVTVRLTNIYEKLTDMVNQQDMMTKTIQILLGREDIRVENAEELKNLLDEIIKQKNLADLFLTELKEMLDLDENASYKDVTDSVHNMKETLKEYWEYLGDVEGLIRIPDGSNLADSSIVTGSAVTVRLTNIYEKLTDMVNQQDTMTKTIQILLGREDISAGTTEELKKLLEEIVKQKEQADQFLAKLKELLGLDKNADYEEVIGTVTDMKDRLSSYIEIIRDLMKQLGMTEGEGSLQNQLEKVLENVLNIMEQLEKRIKELEDANKKIFSLEQIIGRFEIQLDQITGENKNLKEEKEKLDQTISSLQSEKSSLEKENEKQRERIIELEKLVQSQAKEIESLESNGNCSSSSDDSNLEKTRLEKENQELKQKIMELEKRFETQTKEREDLQLEGDRLLNKLIEREKEIEKLEGKLEELSKQLIEKEKHLITEEEIIIGLETMIEKQKPVQELLEQNGIDYEQLIVILKNENDAESLKVKEVETTQTETTQVEETSPTETTQTEETSKQEESTEEVIISSEETTVMELETVEEGKEEGSEKTTLKWMIPVIFVILLFLAGGTILALASRKEKNTKE